MPTKKLKGAEYIYERITADGRLTSYQVKIRRKGYPIHNASFDDLEEAKAFVRQVLNDQDKGHRIDRLAAHRATVGDVIDKAIADIDTGKRRTKGLQSELYRLKAFRKNFTLLCSTTLADATEDMFEDWMEERLETVRPNTVLREVRHLKPLFEVAARTYDLRRSPMAYIKPPREIDERVRRIDPDEEALLFSELARAQDPIVVQAVEFALETGCRRSEQLRIERKHYNANASTVWLPDAKNGRGRDILLTRKAQTILESLPGRKDGGKIFKVTGNQLKKAFEYARRRAADVAAAAGRHDLAAVGTLRWHDLRHEAISRCFDAGWTSEQVMDFSGHVDIKSLLRYRHPKVDHSVARLRAMEERRRNGQLPPPADLAGLVIDERVVIES
jgi:integrase